MGVTKIETDSLFVEQLYDHTMSIGNRDTLDRLSNNQP